MHLVTYVRRCFAILFQKISQVALKLHLNLANPEPFNEWLLEVQMDLKKQNIAGMMYLIRLMV